MLRSRFRNMLLTMICCMAAELVYAHSGVLKLSGVTASTPEMKGDWQVLTIPLKRAGQLFLIEAEIDTLRGNFILDTGAPYLVLNKTYFRPGIRDLSATASGVNGNSAQEVERITVSRLKLSELYYEDIEADVTNLGHLENKRETKILGLLGVNLFRNCKLVLDSRANQLILYRQDQLANESLQPVTYTDTLLADKTPDISTPFRLCDNKIFIPVEVSGQKMNWILDTGAETNVLDAWSNKKIMREFIINRRINLTGSTGEKQDVLLGVMPQLQVGSESFLMQQALVTSMKELSEACSAYIDGILGNNFLSQGIYVIDFKKNQFTMYLYNQLDK